MKIVCPERECWRSSLVANKDTSTNINKQITAALVSLSIDCVHLITLSLP